MKNRINVFRNTSLIILQNGRKINFINNKQGHLHIPKSGWQKHVTNHYVFRNPVMIIETFHLKKQRLEALRDKLTEELEAPPLH